MPALSMAAKPGQPDRSFGSQGVVRFDFDARIRKDAWIADGRIGRQRADRLCRDRGVERLTPRSLPPEWHAGRLVWHRWDCDCGAQAFPVARSDANAVAIQPDGKIVVAGGWSRTAFGSHSLQARRHARSHFRRLPALLRNTAGNGVSIALQPDGKIVVADEVPSYDELRVARFERQWLRRLPHSPAGASPSRASAAPRSRSEMFSCKRTVASLWSGPFSPSVGPNKLVFARYTPSGSADTTFGTNGVATVSLDNSYFVPASVVATHCFRPRFCNPTGCIVGRRTAG